MPIKPVVLWRVVTADRDFYLVAREDDSDWVKQLAKALGLKMADPLPKPLNMTRVDEPVFGRVG